MSASQAMAGCIVMALVSFASVIVISKDSQHEGTPGSFFY